MIRMRRARQTALALCTALLLAAAPTVAGTFKQAPKNGVPDVYIVVLAKNVASKPGAARRPDLPTVAQVAQSLGRAHGGLVEEVWEHALQAFVIRMPEAKARKLAEDPRVLAVEQDFWVSAPIGHCYYGTAIANTRTLPSGTSSPQTISCSDPDPVNDTSPSGPPLCVDNWGLDRIDQSRFDDSYYFTNNGSNVHVYVLDTGIRSTHREFLNASGVTRVTGGVDARQHPAVAGTPTNTDDCHGHGTHVAGIIGGRTYGVAKNAILHPVRTMGCPTDDDREFMTDTARGLNWIVANVERPAVINWSGANGLGYFANTTLRDAVEGVLNADIILVQAAGNQSPDYNPSNPSGLRDACQYSFGGPYPEVIVAAGMDEYDGRWTRRPNLDPDDKKNCDPGFDCGSNAGSCVDIWAPAAHVISSNRGGDDLACLLSGTSMAAPHVTGVVAVYLQSNTTATAVEVEQALRSRGTWGVLDSSSSSANYIGDGSDNVVVYSDTRSMGSDLAPVAAYSFTCQGRSCTFNATGSSDDVGISSYAWRFGDGTTGTGSVVQHVFPANFSGLVTLKVTDGLNHTDHLAKTVTVNSDAPPTATFTYSCTGSTCSFNASGSTDDHGIIAWTWTFGDSTSGSGQTIVHAYPSGGSYTAELTVTDTAGQTTKAQQTIPVPVPPTNVVATASGGTVTISWTLPASADGYDIERKVAGSGWVIAQTATAAQSSTSDVPVSTSGVVLYRVLSRVGTSRSAPSNSDVAYVGTFTDDPLLATAPFTLIKAVHIIQLRNAVNGLREAIGLTAVYAGADLDENALRGQTVDDAHFTTLLDNLNKARSSAGLPPEQFGDLPVQGQLIRRTQIEDLREGVK